MDSVGLSTARRVFGEKGRASMSNHKQIGLIPFLKGSPNPERRTPGCTNFDHHYGGCLFAEHCAVEQGERCEYFERAVLPTAADIGQEEHVRSLYAKHVGLEGCQSDRPSTRECPGCGGELLRRQRYCDSCKKKRRRETYRKARSKRNS